MRIDDEQTIINENINEDLTVQDEISVTAELPILKSEIEQLALFDENVATPIPIGAELTLDDRKFVIESVEEKWGEVFLRDVTFAENTGYPIFRSEKMALIREQLAAQEEARAAQEKAQISPKESIKKNETDILKHIKRQSILRTLRRQT